MAGMRDGIYGIPGTMPVAYLDERNSSGNSTEKKLAGDSNVPHERPCFSAATSVNLRPTWMNAFQGRILTRLSTRLLFDVERRRRSADSKPSRYSELGERQLPGAVDACSA